MQGHEIKFKQEEEQAAFEESFYKLSAIVMGEESLFVRMKSSQKSENACRQIRSYFGMPVSDGDGDIEEFEEQLHYYFEPIGVMWREVALKDGWYKDAVGPMIAFTKEGEAVALIPEKGSGYRFLDLKSGKKTKVDHSTMQLFDGRCLLFYKALPQKSLNLKDLLQYMLGCINIKDVTYIVLITLAATLLGTIMPLINKVVFNYLIPHMLSENLLSLLMVIMNVSLATFLIRLTQGLLTARVQIKISLFVQSAFMQRILMMNTGFFKHYTAGDLSYRMAEVNRLSGTFINTVFSSGLSGIFSFVYLLQIAIISPNLASASALVVVASLALTILSVLFGTGVIQKKMSASAKLNGWVYALLVGIQKIRLTGAEKRAFVKWSEKYAEAAKHEYDPPQILKVLPVLSGVLPLLASILIYFTAANNGTTGPEFMAFASAYGLLLGSVMSLAGVVEDFVSIKPTLNLAKPIMEQIPETNSVKQQIKKIKGDIEVSNLTFRYSEDSPIVLNDVSLHIRQGEYVAIVGKTGCGKSTLVRLLMGFENPDIGAIYYDGINLENLDLRSLRRNIGIVMQDGKLFSGSVLSNITISSSRMSEEQAWDVAEIAGIAEDIHKMPMKMNTHISEGEGGISGGQKQRLLIARALASSPSVVILDEATSALDNMTQKQISDAITALSTTRIVIAHRLSTIKQCDRILMLENGQITEEGTFDALIEKNGSFTKLLQRQMI